VNIGSIHLLHSCRRRVGYSVVKYTKYLYVFAILVLYTGTGLFIPHFLDRENLLNIIRQSSVIAICAVGMTMVIIIKGIDLSTSGVISLCGMLNGLMLLAGMNLLLSVLITLIIGCLIGLLNGYIITKLEVPPFIATLVIGQVATGIALLLSNGRSIGAFPERYVFLGNGYILGMPVSNLIMVLCALIGIIILTKRPIGNHIYALGNNEKVVRQEGIDLGFIKIFVFALSAFFASIGGILLSAQLDTAHPGQGEPFLLDSIAACIIGGVSLMGGEGNILLSVIGAVVIGSIRNALDLSGIHPFIQNIVIGTLIITVVAVTIYAKDRKIEASRVY
jgi:ribose transport system permease protein